MNIKMKTSNTSAERKVLNLLLRFDKAIDMALSLGLNEEDFSTDKNQELFETIVDGYVNSNFVPSDDLEMFMDNIPYEDDAEKKETVIYINKLFTLKVKVAGQTSDINIKMLPKYIDILKALSVVRNIVVGMNKVQGVLMDEDSDYRDLVESVNTSFGTIMDRDSGVVRKTTKEAVNETIQELIDESEGNADIKLGLNKEIDENSKVMRGYVTYVLGAPGIGKSTVALNIGNNVASGHGGTMKRHKVLYVTQEMLINDNIKRIISMNHNIKSHKMQNPKLLDVNDWTKLDDILAKDFFEEYGIMWLTRDNMTVGELRNEIAKYVRLYDIDVVLIDYYQLLKYTNEYEMSESVEIPRVSGSLKNMAREAYLNPAGQPKQVAIIALSQVVKDVEKREDKRPFMNDMYYGGAKDARLVISIYRDEYYYPDDTDKPNIIEFGIVKQNNGIMGIWSDSYFDNSIQKIRDLTDEEKELYSNLDDDDDDYEDEEYDDEAIDDEDEE